LSNDNSPCVFPVTRTDHQGKQHKVYRHENRLTPYDTLISLPCASEYFESVIGFEYLEQAALRIGDNHAADRLQTARQTLQGTSEQVPFALSPSKDNPFKFLFSRLPPFVLRQAQHERGT
jgi:hypothetical protein